MAPVRHDLPPVVDVGDRHPSTQLAEIGNDPPRAGASGAVRCTRSSSRNKKHGYDETD